MRVRLKVGDIIRVRLHADEHAIDRGNQSSKRPPDYLITLYLLQQHRRRCPRNRVTEERMRGYYWLAKLT
jgi:hypothetical protein